MGNLIREQEDWSGLVGEAKWGKGATLSVFFFPSKDLKRVQSVQSSQRQKRV